MLIAMAPRDSNFAICVTLAAGILALPTRAAPGDLDLSFGTGGKVTTDFRPLSDSAYGLAIQGDGKIVVAGSSVLARYNPDGSLDTSFGTGGKVTAVIGIAAVLIQGDGKIVAAGSIAPGGYCCQFALARYHSDGSPDALRANIRETADPLEFSVQGGEAKGA